MTFPDSPRQRRDLLVEAQRLTLEIDRIEDELDHFRERDLPAFQVWFGTRDGLDREVIRGLEAEVAELTEMHNAAVALAEMENLSLEHAYRMIEREGRTFRSANAPTRARIERARARRRAFTAADLETEFRARTRPPGAAPTPDPEALKTIFRKLARRLHPDVPAADVPAADVADETRWRRRYWGLLQSARDRGDLVALIGLDLATRLRQLDVREFTPEDARRAHAWLAREADEFRSELRRAQDTVAWNFTRAAPADVEDRVREELQSDALRLRAEIDQLREEREYLDLLGPERRPDRRRPRATRRPVTTVHQLSFFD